MNTKLLTVVVSGLCLASVAALAQGGGDAGGRQGGRGNWDPAQMEQRMLSHLQETLGAKTDEWKVIEPRLKVVMDKQRAVRELAGGRSLFGRGPGSGAGQPTPAAGQPPAGGPAPDAKATDKAPAEAGRGMGRGPQGPEAAEIAAVNKAVEGGDAAGIKTAVEALRKARTARDADLAKARESLREVLSATQEAHLVIAGILN